jgi:hypothetical protein
VALINIFVHTSQVILFIYTVKSHDRRFSWYEHRQRSKRLASVFSTDGLKTEQNEMEETW